MNSRLPFLLRSGTLLAINLLYLMIWGFAGLDKIASGMPSWFGDKFGATFLGKFPGLFATFWLLTLSELAAFVLAGIALVRLEFARMSSPVWLTGTAVWSLFVFLQLGFGQWITKEFNGAFQQFVYFAGTLLALSIVTAAPAGQTGSKSTTPV